MVCVRCKTGSSISGKEYGLLFTASTVSSCSLVKPMAWELIPGWKFCTPSFNSILESTYESTNKEGLRQTRSFIGQLLKLLLVVLHRNGLPELINIREPRFSYKTMRFKGQVKKYLITILVIDSSSTQNFLDPEVAKRTGLEVQNTTPLNCCWCWNKTSDQGCNKRVSVGDARHSVYSKCRAFTFRGCDMVLGVQRLSSLGPVLCYFQNLQMEFIVDGNYWEETYTPRGTTNRSGAGLNQC